MLRAGIISALVAAVGVTAGCESRDDRTYYDGVYFRTKTEAIDKKATRSVFYTTISGASASLTGARAAAHHEGTRYCIENYGTSNIQWAQDPTSDDAQLTVTDDKLTFQGTCRP